MNDMGYAATLIIFISLAAYTAYAPPPDYSSMMKTFRPSQISFVIVGGPISNFSG